MGRVVALIGRDDELATLSDFLKGLSTGPAAILLEGQGGIGKTTLWHWGVSEAERLDFRVMVSRPLAAETQLSFSVLGDLLDDAVDDALPSLPPPQRHALEVAMLRTEPGQAAPDQLAVSRAFRGAIHFLSKERPLLMALDDLQWLDPPSSRVLAFALNRLKDQRIGLLAAHREGEGLKEPLALDRLLPEGTLTRLQVGPLDGAQVTRLLRDRFGETLSYPLLQQIASTSTGNPFLAIQIAELLAARGARPAPGEPLPVPEDARAVVQARIDELSQISKDALSVCALAGRPNIDLVSSVMGSQRARVGLREAADAGVVRLEGSHVGFAHPLLAAAVYESIAPQKRRDLHRRLAAAVDDPEKRGRHLALGAEGPDDSAASALDVAARHARRRGVPAAGAELLELARCLTDRADAAAMHRRTLKASEYHFEAGDVERARSLLKELVAVLPSGPLRAEALFYLCNFLWCDVRQIRPLLKRALRELGNSGRLDLKIEIMGDLAWVSILGGNLPEGRRCALAALEMAEHLSDPVYLSRALLAVGHAEFFMGGEAEPFTKRAVSLQHALEGLQLASNPRRERGAHLMWAGDLYGARQELDHDRHETLEHGRFTDLWEVLAHLTDLEVRAGNWDRAAAYSREGYESTVDAGLEEARERVLSAMALVEARRGEVEPSRAHATEGLRLAEAHDYRLEVIRNRSVLGFLELSLGNARSSRDYLGPVPELAHSMGLGEPGVFPYIPDLVEALVSLSETEQAEPLIEWLEERGRTLDRPLAVATAARCRGLIMATRGDLPGAVRALQEAVSDHEQVGQPFEQARTFLILGEVRRRHKHKRLARDAFRAALGTFDRLGARLWSKRAREGLRRVGERAESSAALTPTELRVAALVVEGRTNREVAEALFISVKTVEANLHRIYHKIGVRSRTELARRIALPSEAKGGDTRSTD
jgi:DNA-binding CsgD family transcriptional regulator